ncbi:unnamed protein product [Acanthoscelides obtectus]|nr:unnamed protein product [Acanthoscelides obtectus]CAK1644705.1 hypothetical protein AOBTE_LOCUS13926 [Acanthoscelides obtectus]
MSCDSVEESGKEIVKNCYNLHHKAKFDLIKERFLLMVKYAKRWRPVYSAAGICDMNKDFMITVLSTITTYCVVIIQFNNVTQTKRG